MAKGVGVAAAKDKIVEAFELVHQELQKLADQELVEVFAEPDLEPETTAQFNAKSYELVETALCSDVVKPTLPDVWVIEPPTEDAANKAEVKFRLVSLDLGVFGLQATLRAL